MVHYVDNTLLREKYLRLEKIGEINAAEVASRCGWETKLKSGGTKPDSSRVNRTLGITAESGVHRTEVTEDAAVLLCRALHVDPWEVGL